VAAPVAVELLLGMRSVRGKSSESGDGGEEQQEQCARRKTMAAEWGGLITPPLLFLFHLWKLTANLNRSLRSGNGEADLAIHASAPREPRPPLRMVIKETGRTFLTHARDVRSNLVSSRSV
jgi:hypothetical protein